MSENLIKPDLPSYVIGHPLQQVMDHSKIDKRLAKVYRGILNLQLEYLTQAESPIEIFQNHIPTVGTLMGEVFAADFDFDTDLAAVYTQVYELAQYLQTDEGTACPEDLPPRFRFLYNFTFEEKVMLAKSAWRTRNFHGELPFFFAALQLITIFAFGDMHALMKSKMRKVSATAFPDTQLQIPYHADNPETWKAELYRNFYDINTVYTQTQRENLLNHILLTLDSYDYLIPEESVKLGNLLVGKIDNPIFDDKLETILYSHPIDIVISDGTFDNHLLGTDWTNTIDPMFSKLKSYLTNPSLVYEKFEYNDRYYSNSFGAFKEMMKPMKFDSKLLLEWNTMPIPWVQIYGGFHYDSLSFRTEFIFRAWDDNNGDNDITLDLTEGQPQDMFTRANAGLDQGDTVQEYVYALLPYGYDEEAWKLGLTYGWMFLHGLLGAYDEPGQLSDTDFEHDVDWDETYVQTLYYEYYDSEDNLLYQIVLNESQPGSNQSQGWVCTNSTNPFCDIYKPRALLPGAYNDIQDDLTSLTINAAVWDPNNNDEVYARLLRLLPKIKMQHNVFQRNYFKEYIYKLINPRIAPAQSQPPLKEESGDTKPDLKADLEKNRKDLNKTKMFQVKEEKPTQVTDAQMDAVDKQIGKLQSSSALAESTPPKDDKKPKTDSDLEEE